MEYDPAISTHKASSITSTTSTSSNSTWDHPTPTYIHHIKTEDGKPSFEEYSFSPSLVADRISIPSFNYAEDSNNFHFHDECRQRKSSNLIDSYINTSAVTSTDTDNENSTLTNIRKENHEKITDSHHGKDQLNNIVTHDSDNAMIYTSTSTITLPSYGQQQPTPIYLQHGDQITVPSISMVHNNRKRSSSQSSNSNSNNIDSYALQQPRPIRPYNSSSVATNSTASNLQHNRQRSESLSASSPTGCKRSKLNRDLLTDDEKRVNHIASEQKRRNTIRMGFKEMTEIIPTLKNINNSKSTILFKAVEYIKHLDKRNRSLKEKITSLQMRMKVEGRMAEHQSNYYRNSNSSNSNSNTERYNKLFGAKHHQQRYPSHNQNITTSTSVVTSDSFGHLPAHTVSALLAHKNQQRQLEELQEQLRMQQQLLAKHNIITPQPQQSEKQGSIAANDEAVFYSQQQQVPDIKDSAKSKKRHHYNSISIPSSRSSNSEENEHHHIMSFPSTASFIVPQDPNEQSHTGTMAPNTTKRPWHHSKND